MVGSFVGSKIFSQKSQNKAFMKDLLNKNHKRQEQIRAAEPQITHDVHQVPSLFQNIIH